MQLKSVASTQTCLEVLQALGRRGIEWRDAPGRGWIAHLYASDANKQEWLRWVICHWLLLQCEASRWPPELTDRSTSSQILNNVRKSPF